MSENKNKKRGKWTRRAFIATGGLAGVGLIVGVGGNMYLGKNAYNFTARIVLDISFLIKQLTDKQPSRQNG